MMSPGDIYDSIIEEADAVWFGDGSDRPALTDHELEHARGQCDCSYTSRSLALYAFLTAGLEHWATVAGWDDETNNTEE